MLELEMDLGVMVSIYYGCVIEDAFCIIFLWDGGNCGIFF